MFLRNKDPTRSHPTLSVNRNPPPLITPTLVAQQQGYFTLRATRSQVALRKVALFLRNKEPLPLTPQPLSKPKASSLITPTLVAQQQGYFTLRAMRSQEALRKVALFLRNKEAEVQRNNGPESLI